MPPLTEANHAIRAVNVTASEVGALMGEHPYQSPADIWDRLNGLSQPKPQTEAMLFGSEVEPILKQMAERSWECSIRLNSATRTHRTVPLAATADGYIIAAPGAFSTVQAGDLVEFKTSWSQERWRHGLPTDIEWQCRAQMAVLHKPRVWVYAFAGKSWTYLVERDRGMEMKLTNAVRRFWTDHMDTGIRPEVTERQPDFRYKEPTKAKR